MKEFWNVHSLLMHYETLIKEYSHRDVEEPMLTALIVEPGKRPYTQEIRVSDESYFCLLEGPTARRPLYGTSTEIIYNASGKYLSLPACRALLNSKGDVDDVIAGTFLVVGVDEDGEDVSLTEEHLKILNGLFGNPRCDWRYAEFDEGY